MSIEVLASKLKELENNEEALQFVTKNWDGTYYLHTPTAEEFEEEASDELLKLLDDIDSLACSLLITSKGSNNYFNSAALTELGFPVKRGEYDSFGWLSGIIVLKNFSIVYG